MIQVADQSFILMLIKIRFCVFFNKKKRKEYTTTLVKRLWLSGISKLGNRIFVRKNPIRAVSYTTFLLYIYPCCLHHHGQSCISSFHVSSYFQVMVEKSNIKGVQETSCICTGGPLIVLKNGSIFLAKPYYENTNEMAVL